MPAELSTENRIRRAIWASVLSGGKQLDTEQLIEQRFPWDASRTKSAVGNISTGDVNLADSGAADYLREINRDRILGALLPMAFEVEFQKYFNDAMATSAAWVGQFNPIPLSRSSLEKDRLPRLKVGALSVLSLETLEHQNAWQQLAQSHEKAVGDAIDAQLIDPSNLGQPGESPRSLTSYAGVQSVAASADPAQSIGELLQDFRNLNTSIVVSDPETLSRLHLISEKFVDVGARGGTICGIPTISTQGSPQDSTGGQITLIDASRIALAIGGLIVESSLSGSVEMDNNFESDGDQITVDLFQSDSVAMKTTSFVNWKLMDPAGVRILTGCDW